MLYAIDINTDGNKLDSKNYGFGSNPSTDNIINLMFEAPRGRPKDDDGLT